jgi:hypothetical protein
MFKRLFGHLSGLIKYDPQNYVIYSFLILLTLTDQWDEQLFTPKWTCLNLFSVGCTTNGRHLYVGLIYTANGYFE